MKTFEATLFNSKSTKIMSETITAETAKEARRIFKNIVRGFSPVYAKTGWIGLKRIS